MRATDGTEIKAVCFTGHRVIGADFDEAMLDKYLLKLVGVGYNTFICGGALGYDTVVAEKILELRSSFPFIRLHLYIPCRDQDRRWSAADRKRYKRILDSADHVEVIAESYYDGCMRDRNYRMVDNARICICYLNNETKSGTAQTVRYAKKNGVAVINVAKGRPYSN